MKKYKLILLAITISIFTACSNVQNPVETMKSPQKSNLTMGTIKMKVKEGQTSQAEILELFGSPNLVSKNSRGNEVWNYNKMSFETGAYGEAKSSGLFSPAKSSVVSTSTTASFDLIIIFNKNDIVESYKVISAAF